MGQPRIFIGLREIAGYFGSLKKGFDEIGVESAFLNLGGNRFQYEEGSNPRWVNFFNKLGQKWGSHFSKNFLLRFIWLSTFQNFIGFFAFLFALPRYKVFILGGNSSFFFFIDYFILKLLRKKIICVYLGSDARPMYISGASGEIKGNLFFYRKIVWLQKKILTFSEKMSDISINNPPSALFHQKDFISWLHIGVPSAVPEMQNGNKKRSKSIKIVHAPSKKGPKGSIYFEEIINRLKKKYPEIEYIEITGMPHEKVIKTISDADIALDQMFCDTPMAIFATECSYQKIPVVVGGYYADYIQEDYDETVIPPTIFLHPKEVEEEIERLILDRDYRINSGEKAYEFVKNNWKPKQVAERYIQLISGDYPKEWIYDLNNLKYVFGGGIEINALKKKVKAYLGEDKNAKSLYLEDKLLVKKSLIDFVNEED